jgi:hypothetical protein
MMLLNASASSFINLPIFSSHFHFSQTQILNSSELEFTRVRKICFIVGTLTPAINFLQPFGTEKHNLIVV